MEQIPYKKTNQESFSQEDLRAKEIEMQVSLIKESKEDPQEWISIYGKAFRQIVSKDPNMLYNKEELKRKLKQQTTH